MSFIQWAIISLNPWATCSPEVTPEWPSQWFRQKKNRGNQRKTYVKPSDIPTKIPTVVQSVNARLCTHHTVMPTQKNMSFQSLKQKLDKENSWFNCALQPFTALNTHTGLCGQRTFCCCTVASVNHHNLTHQHRTERHAILKP